MKKQMKQQKHEELYLGSIREMSFAAGSLHGIINAVWRAIDPEDQPDYPSEYVFDLSGAFLTVSHEYFYLGERARTLACENATRDKKHLCSHIFETSPTDLDNFAHSAAYLRSYFLKDGIFQETAEKLGLKSLALENVDNALEAMSKLLASIVEFSVEINTSIVNPGD